MSDRAPSQTTEQVCKHLPYEARTQLVRASQTPIVSGDMLARARAIDQATADVQRLYPNYFQKDPS